MTITIDQIKEMNIPVGNPIEMRLSNGKELGYFQSVKFDGEDELIYYMKNDSEKSLHFISRIEEIKILEYKK